MKLWIRNISIVPFPAFTGKALTVTIGKELSASASSLPSKLTTPIACTSHKALLTLLPVVAGRYQKPQGGAFKLGF